LPRRTRDAASPGLLTDRGLEGWPCCKFKHRRNRLYIPQVAHGKAPSGSRKHLGPMLSRGGGKPLPESYAHPSACISPKGDRSPNPAYFTVENRELKEPHAPPVAVRLPVLLIRANNIMAAPCAVQLFTTFSRRPKLQSAPQLSTIDFVRRMRSNESDPLLFMRSGPSGIARGRQDTFHQLRKSF
jgi:hypothetical protein